MNQHEEDILNCIHTYAGIQLRLKCDEIMKKQGYEEPTSQAFKKKTGSWMKIIFNVFKETDEQIYEELLR